MKITTPYKGQCTPYVYLSSQFSPNNYPLCVLLYINIPGGGRLFVCVLRSKTTGGEISANKAIGESQRAMVGAKIAEFSHGGDRKSDQAANLQFDSVTRKQAAGDNQHASIEATSQAEAAEQVAILDAIETVGQGARTDIKPRQSFAEVNRGAAAKQAGLGSKETARKAAKVVHEGAPELIEAVDKGEVSVSAAAKIIDLPKKEQANRRKFASDQVTQTKPKKTQTVSNRFLNHFGTVTANVTFALPLRYRIHTLLAHCNMRLRNEY
ncbi:MAG: hypothetical protein JAZ18_15800 [Candidatus Thiodiazotropha endolucinida]|nr:hypothetical protein [Candidatus Thiodiazotropha endolucinida]